MNPSPETTAPGDECCEHDELDPRFREIGLALDIVEAVLDQTTPICQEIADRGCGYICAGCPAEDTLCAITQIRDILARQRSKATDGGDQ